MMRMHSSLVCWTAQQARHLLFETVVERGALRRLFAGWARSAGFGSAVRAGGGAAVAGRGGSVSAGVAASASRGCAFGAQRAGAARCALRQAAIGRRSAASRRLRHVGEALVGSAAAVGGRRRRCRPDRGRWRAVRARLATRGSARASAGCGARSRRANAAAARRCRTRRKFVGERGERIALRRAAAAAFGLRLQRRPSAAASSGSRLEPRRRTRGGGGDRLRLQRPRAVAVVRQRNGARQRLRQRPGGASATSRGAATARTILGSTTTSVGPPIISRCSTLSRRIRMSRRRPSTLAESITASRGWRPRVPLPPSRPAPKRRNAQAAAPISPQHDAGMR